ncbi:phospholipase D-like domain-containing protein [Methanobacterium petrolearium]|uniref:phospholipase D-like domain-containing protein n=1 Tax=Methanobacterium petrolearium TaxID=710190 RepID=UPI001AE99453|nr:phospholipase D-like domain-containing protein [Methanobacterium petrolearium]MBP1946299.1 phosphatidylserine/phosphatidylglycerophosphate/cardiolipin synthase-like enzyme [Methanobacterium petrolearium]BDZ71395.1 hypothetical protein GCM10025861_19120 [Methanobacterium petrolearium]
MNPNATPEKLTLLGKDQIIPQLQNSILQATNSIMIVGPWLDAYFTRIVIDSLPQPDLAVLFLVRIDDDGLVDGKTMSALNLAQENLENFQARTLPQLHSKVIIIDDITFYLGSANWYWYSLHKSLETTVTGKTSILPELVPEIYGYWEKATPLTKEDLKDHRDLEPIMSDDHF